MHPIYNYTHNVSGEMAYIFNETSCFFFFSCHGRKGIVDCMKIAGRITFLIGFPPNSLSERINRTVERRKYNENHDAGICHALDNAD